MLLSLITVLFHKTTTGDLVLNPNITLIDTGHWQQTFGETLHDCARKCHEADMCQFLQTVRILLPNGNSIRQATILFNSSTEHCGLGSVDNLLYCSEETKSGVYTYFKSPTCEVPEFFLNVMMMGRWWDGTAHGHRYMQSVWDPAPTSFYGKQDNALGFCYATQNFGRCGLLEFGSADEGMSLTQNTTSLGFKSYGYCAPVKGLCKAFTEVFHYNYTYRPNNLYYPSTYVLTTPGYTLQSTFCYFWSMVQCNEHNTGEEYRYRVY